MRIVIDTQATVGQKSGIGHYADGLIRHLDQSRHAYFFLKPDRMRDLNTVERIFWEALRLPFEARKVRADIIHTVGFSAPLIRSCRVVSTVHDLIGLVYASHLKGASRFYWTKWLPYSIAKADYLIASSENTKRDILKFIHYPQERISVIPLAVNRRFKIIDKKEASACLRKYFQFNDFILSVGTLEPRKNLKNLILAYSMLPMYLRRSYPLVVVGKQGWGTHGLLQLIGELGLEGDVRFIGYVPDEELVYFYNASTLFVYPSLYEGFGLPILEAMSCGTPVISSNVSSIPEVTADAAHLIDPLKPLEMADAMKLLLLNSLLRQKLSFRGLERSKAFSWERVAKMTTEVYERGV